MKRSIGVWQFFGFAVASLGGTLLHFLYDWTNKSALTAPFSGVNESTWEHMKLLFWPLFLFGAVQWFFFREYKNFWSVKLVGIFTGILAIPTIFYTYNGMFGKSPDWFNITIFFISAAIAYILETRLFKAERLMFINQKLSFVLICVIAVLFVVFTFYPPEIPLFLDPVTSKYGLQ